MWIGPVYSREDLDQLYVLVFSAHKTNQSDMTCVESKTRITKLKDFNLKYKSF